MATWSAWKSIGSKSYVFETTVSRLCGSTKLTLGTEYAVAHNLGLSSPEDYVCVIDIEVGGNSFQLTHAFSEDIDTTPIRSGPVYHLIGVNTGEFKHAINNSDYYIAWSISVSTNQIMFTFSTNAVKHYLKLPQDYPVKIYLFKP